MGWSYSGDPSKTPLDQVRFLIQDTDKDDQLLNDEEIKFLITNNGSLLSAAAQAAETLMSKFASWIDESNGRVKVNFSQKFEHYKVLCRKLRQRTAIGESCPFAGGLSISEKDAQRSNTDRVQPAFRKNLHDRHPRDTESINVNQTIED